MTTNKEYNLKLNEFEILTLREGLFLIRKNKEIISEEEFKQIDNKIKMVFKLK